MELFSVLLVLFLRATDRPENVLLNFLLESRLSYFRILSICLLLLFLCECYHLLVCFVSAADLLERIIRIPEVNVKAFLRSLNKEQVEFRIPNHFLLARGKMPSCWD